MTNPIPYVASLRLLHDPGEERVADVVWFHHAGGISNSLANRLRAIEFEPRLRIWMPQMPAREEQSEQAYQGDLESLAAMIAEAIGQATVANRPLVLIGHSFGSILAYRTASHLVALDRHPHRLVVMSFPAPDRVTHQTQLHTLSDESLIEQVDQLFGGVPSHLRQDPEALQHFLPPLRMDLGLLERFQHDATIERLPIPLVAVCGTDDRAVELADMQRWSLATTSEFRLRAMPGDHFFPLDRISEVFRVALWDVSPP